VRNAQIVVVTLAAAVVPLAPVAQAAPAGQVIQGDPQAIQELNAARQKFAALRTYRARMSMEGREVMVMEVVNPDRRRLQLPAAPNTPASEIIVIGSESWMRAGTFCRKNTGPAASPAGRDDGDPARSRGNQTVQRGGPESLDGTPTQTYLVSYESEGQQGRLKYYVTPANGMIRRMESSNQQGTVIFDYFDYDAPITITAPC
jgi:outer membrane lipoprotein-sorting protein